MWGAPEVFCDEGVEDVGRVRDQQHRPTLSVVLGFRGGFRFGVQGFEFGIWGLGSRVQGLGFRV